MKNYKISKNEHQIAKPFITVDPDDAKDLDDAIYIETDNSKNNPVFYGLFSVIIALFLGFSAAQLFRWLYR